MKSNIFPEIVKRSETGPIIQESEFERALSLIVKELVQKYSIEYSPENPVPSDNDLADNVYQAGYELFLKLGAYNMSTQRSILFEREEIEEAVASAPGKVTLGVGKDAVVMRHRGIESSLQCIIHSGPTGTPCSEEYHPSILLSCAQEPLVDCLGAGSVSTYLGQPIIPGTPLEIMAAQRDANAARLAVIQAGRPGMHINDVASPLTCAGKMATVHPDWGLRISDGLLVSQMVELKTDYDQLNRAAYLQSIGMHVVDLMTPMVGGLGGGPAGTAVVTVASHLMGVLLYATSYHIHGHMHLLKSTNTDRMGLWIYSVSGQALARNTHLLSTSAIYTRAGLGTEEVLWEVAAGTIAATVSGMHHNGVGATGGSRTDHTSGLEHRFYALTAHACLGKSRQEVNEIVLDLLAHYENTHNNPPLGRPFQQLHNLDTLEPDEQWLEIFHKISDSLARVGLDLNKNKKKFQQV